MSYEFKYTLPPDIQSRLSQPKVIGAGQTRQAAMQNGSTPALAAPRGNESGDSNGTTAASSMSRKTVLITGGCIIALVGAVGAVVHVFKDDPSQRKTDVQTTSTSLVGAGSPPPMPQAALKAAAGTPQNSVTQVDRISAPRGTQQDDLNGTTQTAPAYPTPQSAYAANAPEDPAHPTRGIAPHSQQHGDYSPAGQPVERLAAPAQQRYPAQTHASAESEEPVAEERPRRRAGWRNERANSQRQAAGAPAGSGSAAGNRKAGDRERLF